MMSWYDYRANLHPLVAVANPERRAAAEREAATTRGAKQVPDPTLCKDHHVAAIPRPIHVARAQWAEQKVDVAAQRRRQHHDVVLHHMGAAASTRVRLQMAH